MGKSVRTHTKSEGLILASTDGAIHGASRNYEGLF